MATRSVLLHLLEAEDEPSQKSYDTIVDEVIRDPRKISELADDSVRDDFLILLTTHSHRLAHFFCRLRVVARQAAKSPTASKVAVETVTLIVGTLPFLHQLLEPTKVLDFLLPALDVCFTLPQRPRLRELASVLASSGTLFEHLVSDHLGIEIIRQWASMQSAIALDAETLNVWTERLVCMMHNCDIDHDIELESQQWYQLQALKSSLQSMEHSTSRSSGKHSSPTTRRDLPELCSMTQLSSEDKKSRLTTHQDTNSITPSLKDDDKSSLKLFDIRVPGSKSSLLEVIKQLEGEKTAAILLSLTSRLPCYICTSSLESASQSSKGKTHSENFQATSVPQKEVLNKGLGLWKVLLSSQALRSVLHMKSHGLDGPVTEKLSKIASGDWDPQSQKQAGLKFQRRRLKFPVWKTPCGKNQFILWQISIGMDAETEVPQQEIKVWEVCDYSESSKIIDRVIFLHQSYSDETVRRCLQHSRLDDGMQIPIRFEESPSNPIKSVRPLADLDIRTVDQNIIEMTNKFYALTEPVIRSIISNDLLAEFPFDLSGEEARVIRHFRTASLILGRSGTGKTTCLVFKLVGNYLASKAVEGERPVRQVLLTRSAFLADKLSSYTRRLIGTLSSKPVERDSSHPNQHTLSITEEDLEKATVFTLRDTSFPLVCTWEVLLRILENTAAKMSSRRFYDSTEPTDQRSDEIVSSRRSAYGQLVDFHAFRFDYWPRFSQALTKNLPVHLVFAEIMGVIKGSTLSRESLEPLRREDYLTQSCRLAPTFILEAERSRVYEVFSLYEKLKIELGGVDYVDRVVKLLRVVRWDSSLKQLLQFKFDEVYIDEIQDQRCLDIELLLSFIRNPRGYHFAGDTAQAISQDSTFRFSDIKALFYKHFAPASATTHPAELSRPEMFTLSKNHRSHEGILALASLVMGMIWKGFPETVDKLEPEIGNLNGPKPVLFCGVDSEILRSRDVGQTTLSAGTADFGAEQVILVRDAHTKTSLQGQIGDVALILTILESKGMEFEDVILWNFFSECPDQAGVRSLETLEKSPAIFDTRKHGGMCSELKNLYVAITRARVQLFIMESSETTAATILRFLNNDTSGALIHVTSPSHEDFPMRLEMLRPGTSLDPRQWSQRGAQFMQQEMYEGAISCYRKAQDVRGETIAEGHWQEREGKGCNAKNDIEGFILKQNLALKCFLKANLIIDAARVLVALGKHEDAAEILFKNTKYSQAARLFAEIGLTTKAVDCHHLAREYSEAAAIMNKDRDYDRLVSYLDENRESISVNILQGYSLLCKLLLKQNKTSTEYRKYAIRLLGSSAEREAIFKDYGMHEQLAEFYSEQGRYQDLYRLYSRSGELEKALVVVVTKGLLQSTSDPSEIEVLRILDYVCAGHMQQDCQTSPTTTVRLLMDQSTPNMKTRIQQWESILPFSKSQTFIACQHLAGMENEEPKVVLFLRSILDATQITEVTNLNDLPLEMMQCAVKFTKDLAGDDTGGALRILLLLAGFWRSNFSKDQYILLPWSPLRETISDISTIDVPEVAKKWFLDKFVDAVLTMDTVARELWKLKWPTRCAHFLTIDFCPRQRKGEACNWLHQVVSEEDCFQTAEGLLRVNGFFCDLAVIYNRRALNGIFQDKYLSIKRHWLERLLRELTYVSAVEQHASIIRKTQKKLCYEKKYIAIFSSLEELLYYRLVKEWGARSDFTSLIEQMQLAKDFGSNLYNRLFRAMSHRLFFNHRGLMQDHLSPLKSLEQDLSNQSAITFQHNLRIFLCNLDSIDIQALSTVHALTAVFEYFAAYLILKTCVAACVLTEAWNHLFVPRLTGAIYSTESLQWFEWNHIYQQCLVELTKAFCHVIRRFNEVPQPGITHLCNGKTHHPLLLRQRIAGLVAIVIANLAPSRPSGLTELWTTAKETFGYDYVRAHHFRDPTPFGITPKLASALLKCNGKDALMLVIKDRGRSSPFSDLEYQPGVKTVLFNELCPRTSTAAAIHTPAETSTFTLTDNPEEEYTSAETESAVKIQRLWRLCSRKIKDRRAYMQLPEARAIAHFISLGAQCPDTLTFIDRITFRATLIANGVATSFRVAAARDTLSRLQKDAIMCAEKVEISTGLFESVDDMLHRNSQVEAILNKAGANISDECLKKLVREGVASVLEKAMENVEEDVAKAERMMAETRNLIDAVSQKGT